ncbi:MAG: tetratricopeptide repeat protein [Chloroflexi bacterium]|nr:tetratricopeptide repeat protein [Chloroflexota bacterium]
MERRVSLGRVLVNILILLGLLFLVALPPVLTGWENLRQGEQAMADGRFSEAAASYSLAARRLAWQPALWEQAGQAALAAGDAQAAISLFMQAENKKALSAQGWLALGDAYQQSGDRASALSTWQSGIAQHGPSAALYARLAQAQRVQGDYLAAIEAWRSRLALDAGDADAHYHLGLLLTATRPEMALPDLMLAARLDPRLDAPVQSLRASLNAALLVDDRPYQLVMAGRALATLGDWDLAAEAFRRAVVARGDYADAWAWLGEAHQHLGGDGLSDLEKALLLNPDSAMVNALYGLYWGRQEKPEQALALFRRAISLEPENAAWQAAAGSAAEASGDLVAALAYYKQAVALDPQGVANWRALAAFCARYQVEVTESGLPAAYRLLELAPADWQSQDVMGQIMQAIGVPSSAEKYYLHALELSPGQAAPHFHLGMLYLQMGKAQPAYDHLVKAHKLDPQGDYGWQAGRLLERYFP